MKRLALVLGPLVGLFLAGCQTVAPKDYTAFRQSRPASILVLPPINASSDVRATYSVYTAMTRPISELGYYVFPLVVVDQMMKENGLTMPADMHQAPPAKLREVFGADAALYVTVQEYGSKYMLVVADTFVRARAVLVDLRTGTTLWEGSVYAQAGGQSGLLEALVTQVLNKLTDQAHMVATVACYQLVTPPGPPGQGLLRGPRHPEYGKD
ncbi:GNA1162 family protein [Opitutus sp. ER46]|uniref:DUF799 domain-containing protein n=1 Tax=Opitutus sp. ER46 TaxID=2161864 RepID=UPI000D321C54|nr:GNA1162 family protein [Opitutus sp. ER46]PTX97758.1 hypothetical protein DB354_05625 [Opitutus sp. ER46]